MRSALKVTLAMAVIVAALPFWCAAADETPPAAVTKPTRADVRAAPGAGQPVTVLDTMSVWRNYETLKPPVIQFDDGPKPLLTGVEWLNRATPAPAAEWAKPEFDDSAWLRGSARAFARTPYLASLNLRSRFEVTDPAAVKNLKLTLSYYGGAIVYLNGQELARGHLAKDGRPELAENYPPEAFLADDGTIIPYGWRADKFTRQLALRERSLQDLAVPSQLLRKGVNVLAIELVRAPYHKVVDEKKVELKDKKEQARLGCSYDLSWNSCELRKVQLLAAAADGLTPNVARPAEMQLWNGDFLTPDYESDMADRCEPLRPMVIKGVRNGWFSGRVVLGSSQPIEELKAVCGDLKLGAATIPASALRVRYGWGWGGSVDGYGSTTAYGAPLLDALLEAPRPIFAPGKFGTVVPIWVTLKVPGDAQAGTYSGQLTITAKDQPARTVPVALEVIDWSLPENQAWQTWVELIQSPDVLAQEYGVPLWSERHWQMIGQSLRYINEMGSRVAYVPLVCHTNFGNEESMVRWVKKDNGQMDYDFSVMDKYLDLVQKEMGKPKFVVFTLWEVYLKTPKEEVVIKEDDSNYVKMEKSWAAARWNLRGKGPAVTALEPGSGKVETVYLPRWDDPASKPLWQPLMAKVRERLEQRGLADTMMLGMASDSWPTKEELANIIEASGNLPWVSHTHGGSRVGAKMYNLAPFGYTAFVWNCEYAQDPTVGRLYGWKRPELMVQFKRFTPLNHLPPATILNFEEYNITGAQRGLGRIGADFWPTVKDKTGRRAGYVWNRYPQSLWHSLNLSSHMLVPGPEGPVAAARYEYLRQGLQECEARIAIEKALTDETLKARLGPELAARSQEFLDERLRDLLRSGNTLQLTGRDYATAKMEGDSFGSLPGHCWYVSTGWQQRSEKLFRLAAEVRAKLAEK